VAIVGAGQAGLATSHELAARGVSHLVLDRGRVGQTWRERWQSFCLVTPNWSMQLPGRPYDGENPDGFEPREEIVAFLEPGLYFVGVHFLRTRKSSLFIGVGDDARVVADAIAALEGS